MKRLSLILIATLVGAIFVGCDGDKAPEEPAATGAAAGADAADTSSAQLRMRDPRIGALSAAASGAVSGSWEFADVNGSVAENARGGTTIYTLQLEAHEDPVHLKLRLSMDGEIDEGRYVLGAPSGRILDAAFEHQDQFFRAIGESKGSVELTTITDDRAVGTYQVSLESLASPGQRVELTGTFDMIVQR